MIKQHNILPYWVLAAILSLLLWSRPLAAQKAAARYEINAKRMGLSPTDKDALPRGREFVRLDSTYYVGWMYQGIFMYDRSADELGYQKAIPYLRKAFVLLEQDFTPVLQTLYNSPENYMRNTLLYSDYLNLARCLRDSYEYLNQPDSAIWVINRLEDKDFKRDQLGLMFGTKAWIIHRNRFFDNRKFKFLKTSVAANAKYALQTCYDGFGFIDRNRALIESWFGPGQPEYDKLFIYHYLAMIHSYMQQYDSSEYYYNFMSKFGSISWNNYGSLKHELGEIALAKEFYQMDQYNYGTDKRLMEPFYYLPMLQIYAGNTREAIQTAQEAISHSQSYPGFGWYNIALARGYLYNGNLDSADAILNKAAAFKEVHIGTTLTQQQYEFTIQLLRQVWYEKKLASIKLSDKGWWYKPTYWYKIAALKLKRYVHSYQLATLLSGNPERKRIIYDLFCGESTVSFDEIYVVMKAFGPKYFSDLMLELEQNDVRINVLKYFSLTRARLLVERKQYKAAKSILNELYTNAQEDKVHEKLFRARVLELLAKVSTAKEQEEYQRELLHIFPELMPFSGNNLTMQLMITSPIPQLAQNLHREMKKLNYISWTTNSNDALAVAEIDVKQVRSKYEIGLQLKQNGKQVTAGQKFVCNTLNDIGLQIILRLYGMAGGPEWEPPA
jgi:hypothetical protein